MRSRLPRIQISKDEDIVVCIIGVGYVGKELLEGFGRVFTSIGFDVSQPRLDFIAPDFKAFEKVTLTSDVTQLARGTHYLIAVPTNLHKDHTVNATHLLSAISMVATYARPGATVVIESSVSVGMTRAFLAQYAGTLKCGMSPERVDPGRTSPTLVEIPKVISGLDQESLVAIHDVYSKVFSHVVPVSKPEVAEMTKLYENCYRMVNIAYVNEIADACKSHGINPHEVIDAAATKPFGFQPFRPGLGVGGHCIPVNPYYLFVNNELPVLEFASTRMWARPARLAQELYNDTFAAKKAFSNQQSHGDRQDEALRVLIIGVGFKPGQNVISCSPGLAYAEAMRDIGARDLSFYDPLVPQSDVPWMRRLKQQEFAAENLDQSFDIIAVCMKQTGVDWRQLEAVQKCIVKHY
ncbi:polysaccharide biosynthesis protein vipA/tviB [Coniochaeta ligniaria NRRL 30616]|uniref:Polysaccharide biosynthesis protein vipA/tviB n=1 Tax=Coniochaeta ligniaria NRRL 30616 TaxID=1408157 RepID=A0A1J7JD69_9PEZI|nr:polysaccharide biosynthesis protein vipA/tviB [Coniochaeta ligniaria NRRL 30616]